MEDALELVGLTEFGDRLAKKYSLGMKQRLGLAGALLGRPPILILDEPTNGLDQSGIHEIHDQVISWPSLYDCTVLISSHMPVSYTHLDVYKRQVYYNLYHY